MRVSAYGYVRYGVHVHRQALIPPNEWQIGASQAARRKAEALRASRAMAGAAHAAEGGIHRAVTGCAGGTGAGTLVTAVTY